MKKCKCVKNTTSVKINDCCDYIIEYYTYNAEIVIIKYHVFPRNRVVEEMILGLKDYNEYFIDLNTYRYNKLKELNEEM